jgi:hypothetical protein
MGSIINFGQNMYLRRRHSYDGAAAVIDFQMAVAAFASRIGRGWLVPIVS